jgi:acyl dehydratase
MIHADNLGRSFGPYTYTVERERISKLATAIGETDPRYHDLAAARAAGLPDLPAPPTLATCYGLWANPALLGELAAIGAPLPRLLHGEQSYAYYAPVFAGDSLISATMIVGLEQKRGQSGPFERLTLETTLRNQHGELALIDRLVVVVRGDHEAPGVGNTSPSGADAQEAVLKLPPLTAEDFTRYAEASGDHNPLHTDDAHARAAGMGGVIAHGMLVMGAMGRVAAALAGSSELRSLQCRFRDKTRPGDVLRCGGSITAAYERDGQAIIEAELWARGTDGSLKASGTLVAGPPTREAA